MGNFKISRIYIENFKLFNNLPQPIVLSGTDLMILGGPNGFGKTSIFDVIELALTNQIRRINKADLRARFRDVLFQNDNTKDCIIKVEFTSQDLSAFTIAKLIQANKSTERNSPQDFNIFDTYILNNFDDPLDEEHKIANQEELQEIIHSKFKGLDIKNMFNLVYYIEQEDNKFFLKRSETERLRMISKLFNTDNETQELKKLTEYRDSIRRHLQSLNQIINDYKNTIANLEKNIESNEQVKIEYAPLLTHMDVLEEWDKQEPFMPDRDTKERYLQELEELKKFLLHYNDFKINKENQRINAFLQNPKLLRDTVILNGLIDHFDKIYTSYQEQVAIYRMIRQINRDSFQHNWDRVDFKRIHNYFNEINPKIFNSDELDLIETRIKELRIYKENANETSEAIRSLSSLRDSLISSFQTIVEGTRKFKDNECPVCGADWGTNLELLDAFDKQKRKLENCLDEVSKVIKESLDSLYDKYVRIIVDRALSFFESGDERLINTRFFNQYLESYQRNKDNVLTFSKWLAYHQIHMDIIPERTTRELTEEELNKYEELIYEQLNGMIRNVHSYVKDNMNKFELIFNRLFLEDEELVRKISIDDINRKIQYISFIFYTNNFNEKNRLEEKLRVLEEKYNKLFKFFTKINHIISIYRQEIPEYLKRIMKDIEIVFYIYTGKILQNHQRGLGLFMKESDSRIIRFITHPEKDHDVFNFMSSGQLVAVVLAFTLALNKVYGNKGLSLLLVDDPLQTMDDINIASFVELLRNDFKEKQIILSTHEEHATRYIAYKFSNYNLNVKVLNMKEDFIHTGSGRQIE
jgi:DNA repair protein SbcC/Rad50